MFSLPSAAPEGLWFFVILKAVSLLLTYRLYWIAIYHHIGEFENNSVLSAPREIAFWSMAR